jgi:hypothetical protein
LLACDIADRANGCAADLAYSLGQCVSHGEELIAMIVKHRMIVPKMRSAHMPVKILGLEIQREGVSQECVDRPAISLVALAPRSVGLASGGLTVALILSS